LIGLASVVGAVLGIGGCWRSSQQVP